MTITITIPDDKASWLQKWGDKHGYADLAAVVLNATLNKALDAEAEIGADEDALALAGLKAEPEKLAAAVAKGEELKDIAEQAIALAAQLVAEPLA